jgi:hypothetical protein
VYPRRWSGRPLVGRPLVRRSARPPVRKTAARLFLLLPACLRGGFGDGAAAARGQGSGAGRSAFEAAEPAERGGVRIGLMGNGAAGQHFEAFRRGVAAGAGRANEIGVLGLGALLDEVADQTAAADGEQNGSRLPLDA